MSRSKNFYQGVGLGKVQRSEYDDAKLRDLARHDARLGESLKTVDRARNVMKKSLEADKHMLIKTGLQMNRKMPVTSYGTYSQAESKPPPHQIKALPDARIKRFSVTEMPSDLDRTRQYRKKSGTRPPSYHEQVANSPISKEFSYSHDKLLESRINGGHAEVKNGIPQQADTVAAFGASERLRRSEPSMNQELEQQGADSTNRPTASTTQASKYGKLNDMYKLAESIIRQAEASGPSVSEIHNLKSDEQSIENGEETKDKGSEQSEFKDQEIKPRKKATIWETLSTPKYTSMTKSKRSQIEQEFTASRLKSYRSSPALFSSAKVKSQAFPGQGKPPLPENPSSQGRKGEEVKVKHTTPNNRGRVD